MSEMEQGVARNLLFLVENRISSCGTNWWSLPRQKKHASHYVAMQKDISSNHEIILTLKLTTGWIMDFCVAFEAIILCSLVFYKQIDPSFRTRKGDKSNNCKKIKSDGGKKSKFKQNTF